MKRAPTALLRLAVLAAAVAACGPRAASARTHDFGDIDPSTEEVAHTFEVFNGMATPLRLNRIVPSCVCVSSVRGPLTVDPGVTAELPVRLNVASLAGRFSYVVRAFTDRPDEPLMDFVVRGRVDRGIRASPSLLVLEATEGAAAGKVRISGTGETVSGTVVSVRGPLTAWFDVPGPADALLLSVALDVRQVRDDGHGEVVVEVQGRRHARWELPVEWRAPRRLKLWPRLTRVARAAPGVLEVRVDAALIRPERRLDIEAPEGIRVSAREERPGQWAIRLEWPSEGPSPSPGVFAGLVRYGDAEAAFKVEIP
jgi:hypothetical protein